MWRSKNCPKCGGDIFIEMDCIDGEWYEYCLQCSYRHYLPAVAKGTTACTDEAVPGAPRTRQRKRRGKKDDDVEKEGEPRDSLCSK